MKHEPDPATAPLVGQAFELFSTQNFSLKTLAEEMSERGLRTRYGKICSAEHMKRLLKKKYYIGKLEWQGKEYQAAHEPIISPDLFNQVQEVLKKRSADTGEKGKLEFLLRGTTYCAVCGQKLTGERHLRGDYYRCVPDINKDKCDQPYIPVTHLDSQLDPLCPASGPQKGSGSLES